MGQSISISLTVVFKCMYPDNRPGIFRFITGKVEGQVIDKYYDQNGEVKLILRMSNTFYKITGFRYYSALEKICKIKHT